MLPATTHIGAPKNTPFESSDPAAESTLPRVYWVNGWSAFDPVSSILFFKC
jgi:hypothetical protein